MDELSQRQIDILKAIIKEFTDSGDPVGSEILERKYKLGVSPATIRNEMVTLARTGYLKKAHFSSGRIPSAKGFRFYIQHLMKEKELSTAEEVSYKNSIWDERSETHKLLAQAVKVLAERTGLLSVATTNFGDMYYSGISNLFEKSEFLDLTVSRCLFDHLDEVQYWGNILIKLDHMHQDVLFLLGSEDFSDPSLDVCGSVFGEFSSGKLKGIIGVVGPKRMYYEFVIPQIKYFSSLLEEIMKEKQTV